MYFYDRNWIANLCWKSGNFKRLNINTATNAQLEIAQGATLNIPASDSDRTVEVPWVNYGTVDQTGTVGTIPAQCLLTNHGQYNLSDDASGTGLVPVLPLMRMVKGAFALPSPWTST